MSRRLFDQGLQDLSQPITSLNGSSESATDAALLMPQNNQSYVCGDRSEPLWRKTVWQVLKDTEARCGSRNAVVFCQSGIRWSWSEFLRKVDEFAAGLLAIGLKPGDRLAIWSPNSPQWLITQFATARIGVILVTINPAYKSSELEYALNKSGAIALVLSPDFKKLNYLSILRDLAPELANSEPGKLQSPVLNHLKTVIVTRGDAEPGTAEPGTYSFAQVAAIAGPASRQRLDSVTDSLDPDDPINIQFTSGTTGSPKGATLTHYNIVNNGRFTVSRLHLTQRDTLCIPVPLYHCFGMVLGTLGCVSVGACMVFPDEGFDAATTLAALTAERCTALYGVPTMFVAMLESKQFDASALSTLRTGIMAGAPCPEEVMKMVMTQMHMSEVTIAYGMTETSPVSMQNHIDDPLIKRVATVGRIHPHTEVKIVDESGRVTPVGQSGELCTRGYLVMQGYWNDASRTDQSIDAAGWMHSGDLAVIDAEGYCAIVGRVKDMLIRGGENIYPREIEELLFQHPKIQQAQVFGVPDKRLGERVCAWVVLQVGETMTETDLQEYCRERMAIFKVPEYVRFKDELPMTATGKPQKFVMRDRMIAELDAASR